MQRVILCKGIQASGKSTWSRDLSLTNPSFIRISKDDLRNMLDANKFALGNEAFVSSISDQILKTALRKGLNVVIDNTHLRASCFTDICKLVEGFANESNVTVEVSEKFFPIALDEAIKRDLKRVGRASVGSEVIRATWKRYMSNPNISKERVVIFGGRSHGINVVPTYIGDHKNPQAIICDLDGTAALIGARSPFDATRCDELDIPNIPVIQTVQLYHDAGYKIVFLSGREDKSREPTLRFIKKHVPTLVNFELHMRKTGDMRKDSIIKRELWDAQIAPRFNVLFVMDDRNSVVELWRNEIGLTCFQVGEGNF